jgi:hypothetical protein
MDELEVEVEPTSEGGIVRVRSSISPQRLTLQQAQAIPVRYIYKTQD